MKDQKPMPHNGELINNFAIENKLNRAEIGRSMTKSDYSVYKYAVSPSLQARILWKLSILMNHNFLADLANQLDIDFSTNKQMALEDQIEKLQAEISDLKKLIDKKDTEIEVYKEVVKSIKS